MDDAGSFDALWESLLPVGREPSSGGYRRYSWSRADHDAREWFAQGADQRGLSVETDRNGNLWAWHNPDAAGDAIVTGSHLDSVADGGGFDGALGVVAGFAAFDCLTSTGRVPAGPLAVVAFVEEEGARFGVPCLGSRLLTGTIGSERALGLRDADGTTYAETLQAAGIERAGLGWDPDRVRRIGAFIELHVEQGRGLVHADCAVGVGRSLHPHGRWRLTFRGRADHAGTTALADRHDPMLPLARTVLAVREAAATHGALATVGRVLVEPNGTNVIPSVATIWLDARSPDAAAVRALVEQVVRVAEAAADPDVEVSLVEESWSPEVILDVDLAQRVARRLGGAPLLSSGAGHDAGVLAGAGVPTVMLFVRNPTGVSHAPAEHAERDDCLAGVRALADALATLAAR
ncbi:MAG TPA: allantoate amidohydrolase [Sporichthyaceae bacterium]|nr:allantoate amidohydrolase [Sporichthyaceae bacterium]